MTHRTFRSLDQPPKLVGFSVRQWAALIAGGVAVLGVVHVAALPSKAAITLAVFALGLPAALTYVSEAGGLRIGALLRDALAWRLAPKRLLADSGEADARNGVIVLGEHARGQENRRLKRNAGQLSRSSERARR
jgi:hypothetical protein